MTKPRVDIIVLNWNGSDDTIHCMESLRRQTYSNFRIVVVDNGSTDDSLEKLAALAGPFHLVQEPINLGYTGGNNRAMKASFADGAEYVWLFNSDAEVDSSALDRLIEVCEADPRIGLASPLVREADNPVEIQFGCGLFDLDKPDYVPSYDIAQSRTWMQTYPDRIALHGTALLIRKKVYDQIGELDDTFFAYWEDIDYSIRSARAGFKNVVVLDTAIYHGSKPTRAAPETVKPHYYYFVSRNELFMWRKICTGLRLIKVSAWTFRRQLLQIARMPGNTTGIDAILAGLWHGWTGKGGAYDSKSRMPWPARWLLGHYPDLFIRLLGGGNA